MVDSISAFMSAILCFTFPDDSIMLRRQKMTTSKNRGSIMSTSRASLHWTVNITTRAPIMVAAEISISSGP